MDTTEFSERDLRIMLNRAMRTVLIAAVIGCVPIGWAWGWRSMALYCIGAAIGATGIFEWRQIVAAVLDRLNMAPGEEGLRPRPIIPLLIGFFLRLAIAAGVLYVSLRGLEGKVAALILGLALAMAALLIEAIRIFRAWTF